MCVISLKMSTFVNYDSSKPNLELHEREVMSLEKHN